MENTVYDYIGLAVVLVGVGVGGYVFRNFVLTKAAEAKADMKDNAVDMGERFREGL